MGMRGHGHVPARRSALRGPPRASPSCSYELLADGLRTTLSWDDGTDLPCSLGLHPWFRRRLDVGGDVVLTFDPDVMVERGADALPTGRLIDADARAVGRLLPSPARPC